VRGAAGGAAAEAQRAARRGQSQSSGRRARCGCGQRVRSAQTAEEMQRRSREKRSPESERRSLARRNTRRNTKQGVLECRTGANGGQGSGTTPPHGV